MDKTCTICKEPKSLSEFNKKSSSKDGLQNVCRACNQAKSRDYYKRNKVAQQKVIYKTRKIRRAATTEKLRNLKVICGCAKCSEKDFLCLEFHHVRDKEFLIAETGRWAGHGRLLKELVKCIVLCSNCHRKLHGGRFSIGEEHMISESLISQIFKPNYTPREKH